MNYKGWIFWARTYSLQELIGLEGIEGIRQFLVLLYGFLYQGLCYRGSSKLGGMEKLRIYVLQG
jgi:hypothetical protein